MADSTAPPEDRTAAAPAAGEQGQRPIQLRIGPDELVIRGLYETLSIVNDVLIGLIFLIGSFLFFSDATMVAGTWLFVAGSVLMLVRPCIRLTRRIHLQRINPALSPETARDF
ncbi:MULTISPECIES: YrhK family protein [Rothia]|uniref:YrhK family protein n=1 Tax=Rothia kristinae TaxID=37923 RepID=A0A7T3CEX1_9MICC|nr:YrhK family protein [Rothia kristinae]TDP54545.1 YrhK-like protein [Kocuria sp. AG109]SIL63445.1 Uncharacterised protein [Mycobacteroides abscessus subsp. abscessus]MBG7586766.1 YrhK family protein [Rothia kristinae]MCA1169840.1 YrhK family protein [Rothia kristinae]MCT1356389.1 YrhK family protein [Rothia kristinae]